MPEIKTEIAKDKPLNPGDIVELHFTSISMVWIQAAQIAIIETLINRRHKEFTILSDWIPEKNKVVFKVRVNETNPVIVTALVIAGAISAVGIIAWLNLDKVYQIISSAAGATISIGVVVIAAVLLLIILRKGGST